MKNSTIFPLNLIAPSDELKKLIAEHPDYPIVVLAGDDANTGDYTWMYCSSISFSVGKILDCAVPWDDESVVTDEDEFNEYLEDWLFDEIRERDGDPPEEEEFQKILAAEKERYAPYWKNVIGIWAGN